MIIKVKKKFTHGKLELIKASKRVILIFLMKSILDFSSNCLYGISRAFLFLFRG